MWSAVQLIPAFQLLFASDCNHGESASNQSMSTTDYDHGEPTSKLWPTSLSLFELMSFDNASQQTQRAQRFPAVTEDVHSAMIRWEAKYFMLLSRAQNKQFEGELAYLISAFAYESTLKAFAV